MEQMADDLRRGLTSARGRVLGVKRAVRIPKQRPYSKRAVLDEYPRAFLAVIEVGNPDRPKVAWYLVALSKDLFGLPSRIPRGAWALARRYGLGYTMADVKSYVLLAKGGDEDDDDAVPLLMDFGD